MDTSPTYPQDNKDDGGKVLTPEDIPLKWGKFLTPFSSPHPKMDFNPIKWYWIPAFNFDVNFLLSVAAFLCLIIGPAIYAAQLRNGKVGGSSAIFAISYFLAFILGYIRVNIAINQSLRTAICRCLAKREKAIELWENANANNIIYSKDVFHTEKTFFYHIVVLRDGTVEVWNGNEGKINEKNGTVHFGMQAKVNAGDVNKMAGV